MLAILTTLVVACSGSPTSSSDACVGTSGAGISRAGATCQTTTPPAPATPVVTRIVVSPEALELALGDMRTIAADVFDQNGNRMVGTPISWRSNDPSVASRRGDGRVEGLAAGQTALVAFVEGVTDSVMVTVSEQSAATVVVSPDSAALSIGETVQLDASSLGPDGSPLPGRTASWTSSDPYVATVSPSGLVTAQATGTAQVLAEVDGVIGTAELRVEEAGATAPARPASLSVEVGGAASAVFEVGLSWSPVDGASAYRVAAGAQRTAWTFYEEVTATSASMTVDTATDETYWICVAAVNSQALVGPSKCAYFSAPGPAVDRLVASPQSMEIVVGSSRWASASALDQLGNVVSGVSIEWSSSSPTIASVSAQGQISAAAAGQAFIIASFAGLSDTIRVEVVAEAQPVDSVSVTPATRTLDIGSVAQLSASPRASDGSVLPGREIVWSSVNPAIASVSSSGLVTANAAGAVDIVAASEGVEGTARIIVTSVAPAPVASVDVTPDAGELQVGGALQLSATTRAADSSILSGRVVSWSSDDGSIATVSTTGLVTAQTAGTVVISATSEGITDSALITVSTVETPPPGMPQDVSVEVGEKVGGEFEVAATWSSVSGAARYRVTGGLNAGGWSFSEEAPANTATLPYLWQEGASYWVCAAALNATGVAGSQRCTSFDAPAGSGGAEPVAQVTVTPGSVSLTVGQSRSLSAVARDAAGQVVSGASVSWESLNGGVATVSSGGVVTGVAAGTTAVVGSVDGVADTVGVSVTPARTGSPYPWYTQKWDFQSTGDMESAPDLSIRETNVGAVQFDDTFTNTPWGGTKGFRGEFLAAGTSETVGVDIIFPDGATDKPRELWVSVWMKYDAHFRTVGDHKTVFVTEREPNPGANRWELKVGYFGHDIGMLIANGNVIEHKGCFPPLAQPQWQECPGGKPDLGEIFWDGEWHELRLHVKMSTDESSTDGAYEAWWDGSKFYENTSLNSNSLADSYFDVLALGRNGRLKTGVPANMYWGEVNVYIENPGW